MIQDKFKKFANKKIDERNKKLIASQNLMIDAKDEFISIFKNSQSISTSKGKSQFLVRAPKKTKDQLMIQDLVGENKIVIDKISKLKRELDILQNKMADYDELQREADLNAERLHKLLEMGVINENDNLINNEMS